MNKITAEPDGYVVLTPPYDSDSTVGAAAAALAAELGGALERAGFVPAEEPASASLVVNVVDREHPRPFRRKARGTFVAALVASEHEPEDGLRDSYPILVRALANIALCYIPETRRVLFTTMERGHYGVTGTNGVASLADAVVARLAPLARSHLVIDNEFRADLEPELWYGDGCTDALAAAGRRLDELDLLPAPFPIEELLDARDLAHVARLYSIGGLSYGNLSVRKDASRFWMSASGVDKADLCEPGVDMLLVSGYDADHGRMVLSVPPGITPKRVSVDAIEHWMIYGEHPNVGAILHVHAWMEGIEATQLNYPCGTHELATSVAELIAREEDPAHAVVGLKNHGITATGATLEEILDRIEPQLLRQVPMT
jgi:ribulose-5-phosphate 4-epimerase/fuculose-1-phosphate aldolase